MSESFETLCPIKNQSEEEQIEITQKLLKNPVFRLYMKNRKKVE